MKIFEKMSFWAMMLGLLFVQIAFAQSSGSSAGDIGSMADNVTTSFSSIGKLMVAAAYVAGFGLVAVSLFKFKQHKDNPTQITLGTPMTLLIIGCMLVFLPSLFAPAGQTLFGGSGGKPTAGGFTGSGAETISGGSSQ